MSKKIKFNLLINGDIQVSNVTELQENFYATDVMNYYKNGALAKWLKNRNEIELLEKVTDIKVDSNQEILKELARIFSLHSTDEEIEAATAVYETSLVSKKDNIDNVNEIVRKNYSGYLKLIREMQSQENIKLLELGAQSLVKKYVTFFKMNSLETFDKLSKNIRAIFACLTEAKIRELWLTDKEISKQIKELVNFLMDNQSKYDFIKVYCKNTDGEWEQVESKDKQIMIINLRIDLKISNMGTTVSENGSSKSLTSNEVNDRYPIFNGLDVLSDIDYYKLYYLEV
ncbi:hypothetical protein AALT52_01925 [Ligilactobacillus faecis]|uniref:Uncharacterized protein n=1 Tax=Ligilactobacillus faecis TaxID=762833 RepID=A0ABV4DME6_9LACO